MRFRLFVTVFLMALVCGTARAQTCSVTTVSGAPNPPPPTCYNCSGMAQFTVPDATTWEILSASTVLTAPAGSGSPYVAVRDVDGSVLFGSQLIVAPSAGTYRLTFAPGSPDSAIMLAWMTGGLPIGLTLSAGQQFQIGMTGSVGWRTDVGAKALVRSCQ